MTLGRRNYIADTEAADRAALHAAYEAAEEQREAKEAADAVDYDLIAEPVAAALNGWLASQAIARKAA